MSNKKIIFSGFMAALLMATGANAAEIASKGYVDNRESAVKTWVGTQDYATSTELDAKANTADLGDLATKDTVGTADITDASVTAAKLAAPIVTSLGKADTSVQPAALTTLATKTELAAKANTADLGALATKDVVDTAEIKDASVTAAKLAAPVVTSLGKADTAIQAAGLAPYAKTADLGTLAAKDTIVTADITDANVTKAKLAADVVTSLGKADTSVQPAALTTLATKTELAAKANSADLGDLATKDTVGTVDITDASVTAAKLAAPVVTSLGKADTAIQAAGLAPYAKTADLGTLAAKDAIVTADITDANVTKAKLAADVVTSLGKADTALQGIADASVTEAKLSASVNASLDLADSSVQNDDLAPYAKTAAVLPKPSAECLTATANCVLSINKTTKEIYWANVVE